MQILLNLLPDEKKTTLVRRLWFRFFAWQTVLLMSLALLYVLILGGINYLLAQEVAVTEKTATLAEERSEEAARLKRYQEVFKEINDKSAVTYRYTENHLHWTKFFTLLDRLVGQGIVVTGLLTQNYTVTLNGQAATRDDFLGFEAALRQSECVSDVKVPISNLFSPKEIEFQITFNLKRDCLLRGYQ